MAAAPVAAAALPGEAELRNFAHTAAHLINQGLYVELAPFDAHIFLVEPDPRSKLSERAIHALRLAFPSPKLRVPARSGLSHFWRSFGGGQ